MKMMKIKRSMSGTLIAFLLLGLFTFHTNAQTPVNGLNVTKVEFGRTAMDASLVQTGPKEWTQIQNNGQVSVKYTETGRDEWSVYLTSQMYSSAVINLFQKTVVMKNGNSIAYEGKVLNSSSNPITQTTAVRSATTSPLTPNETAQVMKWISVKTSAARLPFCWRQSYGRGAGTPMICQPGYNQETAGLCSQPCGGDERGIATFCYKNCPA